MPHHVIDAAGSSWKVTTERALDAATIEGLRLTTEAFEAAFSDLRPASLTNQLTVGTDAWQLPECARPLLEFSRRLSEATDGLVEVVTIRAVDPATTFGVPEEPSAPLSVQDISIDAGGPIALEVGPPGRGYLADLFAEMLRANGHREFEISGGGVLIHQGDTPIDIDLVATALGAGRLGTGRIANHAIGWATRDPSASGGLDPVDAEDREFVAAWVVADSAMAAAGLATALLVSDPGRLAPHSPFSYVRARADGTIEYSTNFDGSLPA